MAQRLRLIVSLGLGWLRFDGFGAPNTAQPRQLLNLIVQPSRGRGTRGRLWMEEQDPKGAAPHPGSATTPTSRHFMRCLEAPLARKMDHLPRRQAELALRIVATR